MPFETIIVVDWRKAGLKDIPYTDQEEFVYSTRRMNKIVSTAMSAGYQVMLMPAYDDGDVCVIALDKHRFRQA
jgi:hypothetical protein